jgi:hypothetical protein
MTSNSEAEISSATSASICTHMNDDHAAKIHARVAFQLSSWESAKYKVKNVKMVSVTMREYIISFVMCSGEACQVKKLAIPFNPPLNSSAEVSSRLVEDYNRALIPKFTWIITDPLMRMLFGACILLGIGTILGQQELVSRVNETPWARSIVNFVFGTPTLFAKLVTRAWYFALIAHTMEASYTAYLCKTFLEMNAVTTMKWFVLNVCTGFPIMNKVKELHAIDCAARLLKSKRS